MTGSPSLRLAPAAQSVAEARRFTDRVAARLGADKDARDTLQTLVSEIVTNAVLHAGTDVLVFVTDEQSHVAVSIADGSPAQPRQRRVNGDSTTGRGLRLLHTLSSASGTRPSDAVQRGGKAVWFTVGKVASDAGRQAVVDAALELFDVDLEGAW